MRKNSRALHMNRATYYSNVMFSNILKFFHIFLFMFHSTKIEIFKTDSINCQFLLFINKWRLEIQNAPSPKRKFYQKIFCLLPYVRFVRSIRMKKLFRWAHSTPLNWTMIFQSHYENVITGTDLKLCCFLSISTAKNNATCFQKTWENECCNQVYP